MRARDVQEEGTVACERNARRMGRRGGVVWTTAERWVVRVGDYNSAVR